MCGDIEEEDRRETALFDRFVGAARGIAARRTRPESPEGAFASYLDRLYAETLARCVHDGEHADESTRYRMMAMQAVVLARAAGFIAAHVARGEDPMRRAIDALLTGYGEGETAEPDHGHDHDHDHANGHHHH